MNAKGEPPSEFRIFKAGKNRTSKGEFTLTAKSCASVMAAYTEQGNPLAVDYNHAMLLGRGDPADDGSAAAWFKPESRDGDIWATDVEWTPRATKKLLDREFRFVSPAFDHDKREITSIINVALTNIPATKNMTPIVASQIPDLEPEETEIPMLKNLVAMLSLAEKTTEAEALAEISTQKQTLTSLLALTGKEASAEALAVVTVWKDSSAQVEVLSQRIAALETEKKDGEVKAILEKAILEKRVSPAEVEKMSALGKKDFEMFKSLVAVRPVMLGAAAKENAAGTLPTVLNAEEMKIAEMLGQSPEDFAKAKANAPLIPVSTVENKVDANA